MAKCKIVLLISILAGWPVYAAHAQDVSPAAVHSVEAKVVVAGPEANSDSVIAVPPSVSQRVNQQHFPPSDFTDLATWLDRESPLNGLQSQDVRPWHIVITYDRFDEDGDNVDSGVYEEFWAG